MRGRFHASDERATGLQATWRPAYGFTNLSLWRHGRCVETFHLTPQQAGELVAFIASSLAEAVPPPSRGSLALVSDAGPAQDAQRSGARQGSSGIDLGLLSAVERVARRWLRRSSSGFQGDRRGRAGAKKSAVEADDAGRP